MSSSDDHVERKILILDKDPPSSHYRCPLTTCTFQSKSPSAILSHMWKFKGDLKCANSTNKSCTGQTSPSLTLYPKLFCHSNTYHTLSSEYPHISWHTLQQYMNPPNHAPPQLAKLIQEFDMFITTDFINDYNHRYNHRFTNTPKSIQAFFLNPGFNPRQLPSLLRCIKQQQPPPLPEPPHKKRKLSSNTATTDTPHEAALTLPSLNILTMTSNASNSKSEDECMVSYDPLSSESPRCTKTKRVKRRGIGPICGACNTELNPCDVMIQCTECEYNETKVIICIFCFKTGCEFAAHKRFHRYLVLRPLPELKLQSNDSLKHNRYKVSHSRWCGKDEWNLLHGLRRYGLGNWLPVTKMINKSSDNKHYECKYIEEQFYTKYGDTVHLDTKDTNPNDHTQPPKQAHNAKGSMKRSENIFTEKHKRKCGYRELRDEFEAEWNNNAEAMIGDMYFSPYDTEKERALKLEGIRIYNTVLKERETRKRFIKHYGVICKDRHIYKRNMNEHEVELEQQISDHLAVFARYTEDKSRNFAEFRSLTQGLIDEHRLRQKIYKLRHYLLNGVTSVAQMETIEKYVQKQQELKECRDEYEEEDDEEDVDVIPPRCADEYLNRYHGCSLDAISTYLKLMESESNNNAHHKKKREREKPYAYAYHNNDNNKSINEWNVNKMKDAAVLNEGEKKLCNVLKIAPYDYQYIQQEISKRVCAHGLGNRGTMPQQLYIDIDDVTKVKQSMTMRIGLVDPCILTKEVVTPNRNTN